ILPKPSLQFGSVSVPDALTPVGIVTALVTSGARQPLLSLTATVWEPLLRLAKVAGEVHAAKAPLSRLHVYPAVPPEKVIWMLPKPSLQFGSVSVPDALTPVGIVTALVTSGARQPLLSLTATVWEPLLRLAKVAGEVHAAKAPLSRLHVYPAVPPEKVIWMLPKPSLQFGSVSVPDASTPLGIVTVLVTSGARQPLLSLTATVWEPLLRLAKVAGEVQAAKAPLSRLHVYPAVPPEKVIWMLPKPSLQFGSVSVPDASTPLGIVTVLVTSGARQPLLSLTATVWEPLLRLPKVAGEVQAAKAPLSRLHVYPGVPPEKVTWMLPKPSLQFGSVSVPDAATAVGIATVLVTAGPKQPLLSFTVTVCEPLVRLLNAAGEVHAAKAPLSRLHVYPAVPPENVTCMLPNPSLQFGSVSVPAGPAQPLLSLTVTV